MGRRQSRVNGKLPAAKRPHADEIARLAANIRQLIKMERHELAVEILLQLQQLDPGHVEGLVLQGELELETGQMTKALHSLLAASYQLPSYPRIYWLLARLHTLGRQDLGAISALLRFVELQPADSRGMLTLAALYTEAGHIEQASHWMHRALRLEPYRCMKPLADRQHKLRLLVLMTAESTEWRINRKTFQPQMTEGHNNLSALLDSEHIEVWRLFVDEMGSAPEIARKLPAVDLIYNGITDAERCAEALTHAERLCERLGKPIINQPRAVLAASREGNYVRFKDHTDIILPKSVKLENASGSAQAVVAEALRSHDFTLPVIIRLAGFQGGKYMHKVDDLEGHDFSELDAELEKQPQTVYVIQYHDVSYTDPKAPGTHFYPKYRAFMVGGTLYPCHLFTADSFNVHKKNADPVMLEHPWLVEQEQHYCSQPAESIGQEQWQQLSALMRDTALEYVGVDFAPATDPALAGKLVVFELNPAMRNWVDQLPEGHHVQQAWREITHAAHELLCERAGLAPWAFNLPKGLPPELKPDDILTLHLHIKGKVQGVGYRRWLADQLETRGLPGWVQNLSDGSLEAVVHGKLADLQPLCDEVPTGPEGSEVTGLEVTSWEGEVPQGVQIR